ncbi:MAG: hypothetical protein ACRDJY_00120 [Thermoleophilaceae bacterium]
MSDRPRNHGYAAFEPADTEDAKRGRPDFDLSAYSEERGLGYLDKTSALLAGWKQALPRKEAQRRSRADALGTSAGCSARIARTSSKSLSA